MMHALEAELSFRQRRRDLAMDHWYSVKRYPDGWELMEGAGVHGGEWAARHNTEMRRYRNRRDAEAHIEQSMDSAGDATVSAQIRRDVRDSRWYYHVAGERFGPFASYHDAYTHASRAGYSADMATDPPVSEAQRRAMYAAASGHSTLGIPKKVGEEFVGKARDAISGRGLGSLQAERDRLQQDLDKFSSAFSTAQRDEARARLRELNREIAQRGGDNNPFRGKLK